MRVLGTAGHVDHGKSTLVHALTGINPDRLREEQERQMTIDLGFAWMRLPGGEEIGLVDVPGHRDFIENMLAGVSGIDAALLVIAADEGVMPQTREHLAILDLLEIPRGVVALTKADLVDDPAWLELVTGEVRALLGPTRLSGAPIVPVSSVTGVGLDVLQQTIAQVIQEAPPRRDLGRPRLPIDRAFTIAGFGTVVTGTLADGSLEVGQEVELLPSGRRARIRGLQTHKHKVEQAVPGSRTAANLTGVEVGQIERGDVLALPGTCRATRTLDVHARLLEEAADPIRHDQRVKIFLGAAQRIARVRLLGQDQLSPGDQGWLQLVLDRPIAAAQGDLFILRRPSPGTTLGGGKVIDPNPIRLHRRRDSAVIERLERQSEGTPEDILAQAMAGRGPLTLRELPEVGGLTAPEIGSALESLRASGLVLTLGEADGGPDTLVIERSSWQGLLQRIRETLRAFHTSNPLRLGMPREELKSRLRLEARPFAAVVAHALREQKLREQAGRLSLPDHQVVLSARQKTSADDLLARFRAAPANPPSVKESLQAVGEDLLMYLLESQTLVQLSADVILERTVYDAWVVKVRTALEQGGTITVAQVRDLFATSRKFALALMEHLDGIGVTAREGDLRRLAKTRT